MKIRPALAGLCLLAVCLALRPPSAQAQQYHNLVNTRFNTVASGPMHALIVDVKNAGDSQAVSQAVARSVIASRKARESAVLRELALLKQYKAVRSELSPGIPDIVIVRENGRLALPTRAKTRGRAPNDINFVFPAAGTTGSWSPERQQVLQTIINVVYPELKNVYGDPSWSGTVTILNGDNMTPVISDRNAIWGGVYDVTSQQITFAQYNATQTIVLNLTQMMALAFHGPNAISYDAWERGMARAATVATVRNVLPLLQAQFANDTIDVSDPFYHALERYDLLNQPPLGNDRFFPVSQTNNAIDPNSLAGMLVPRMQMASSAWLKVYAESPTFFNAFNTAYYAAVASNPAIKNSIPDLKQIARSALPSGQVEGLDFLDWYQRQYVLDTSVAPGNKLYAWPVAVRPDATQPAPNNDDFAIAVVLVYYRTVLNGANSDEQNLGGTCYPIYWHWAFDARLFLAAQYERVDIRNGVGSVAPTFFNNIGTGTDDPNLQGRMRIAMDFPVNQDSVRLYVAPRSMGTQQAPNNFWGTVVGADAGTIKIDGETGSSSDLPVAQGAFGGTLDPSFFSRPQRATITFTPAGGGTPITRRVNTGFRELITVLYASDPVTTRSNPAPLPAGPSMVSFPIQPLKPKAADALLNPANDQPLFNDTNLLMAQWQQNLGGDDKYARYPALDPIQPGKGYWIDLPQPTTVKIVGKVANQDQDVSLGLVHGWNQIGDPYEQPIDINALQFQYLADNQPVGLQDAISRGWIVAQNVPGVGNIAVYQFDQAQGYVPASQIEPWRGYWIRVLVSEGVTITFPTPTRAARLKSVTRAASPAAPKGWSLPLTVRGPNGFGATAYLGQADSAGSGYDAKLDAPRPPEFSRAVPTIAFPHPEWGANAGDYFSDIRRTASRDSWDFTVYTPEPNKTYTLSWNRLSSVPRSIRLLLVDPATGQRQYLQTSSGYSFTAGSAAARKFQIVLEDRNRAGLMITNVVARQTRAAGSPMELSYTLSTGATVVTEIRDASGQVIRHLVSGRAATAGINTTVWDLRNDRAASVPAGAYMVHISARSPEGDAIRVVQPILVIR